MLLCIRVCIGKCVCVYISLCVGVSPCDGVCGYVCISSCSVFLLLQNHSFSVWRTFYGFHISIWRPGVMTKCKLLLSFPKEVRKKHKDAQRKLKAAPKSWGFWEKVSFHSVGWTAEPTSLSDVMFGLSWRLRMVNLSISLWTMLCAGSIWEAFVCYLWAEWDAEALIKPTKQNWL